MYYIIIIIIIEKQKLEYCVHLIVTEWRRTTLAYRWCNYLFPEVFNIFHYELSFRHRMHITLVVDYYTIFAFHITYENVFICEELDHFARA